MSASSQEQARSGIGWVLLRIVLLLETLGGLVWLVSVFARFLSAGDDPMGARVSVLLAAVLSWVWIVITLVGIWKKAGWARGSALTLHVLMFAAASGILQGILGPMPAVGVVLIVLSIIGFVAAVLARPDSARIDTDGTDSDGTDAASTDSASTVPAEE